MRLPRPSDVDKLEEQIHRQVEARQARNVNAVGEDQLTFGDRMADAVAAFTGSWTFLITFVVLLAIWVVLNTYWVLLSAFDPYPYILLNLVLACITAVQAPLIMMSQNRQAAKEKVRSDIEYHVNLKSEIILEHLHDRTEQGLKTISVQLDELSSRLDQIEARLNPPQHKIATTAIQREKPQQASDKEKEFEELHD